MDNLHHSLENSSYLLSLCFQEPHHIAWKAHANKANKMQLELDHIVWSGMVGWSGWAVVRRRQSGAARVA
ncbi:hypothetical protein L1987_86577 [Smallanthus sonchifolius]|uniref:Uncharacterized protein n=1 Tax=Smallanthus sonchifolius TaxID=185202 RepID=A0ACB8Y0B2_9ASTR|nr:hypothetical protein L1987_86577 [Smallanthus sonchifolius]